MKVLTKSKFKLGLECPNKLFYTSNHAYANQKKDDPFMKALAEGGFQVEELARMHYPDGIFIEVPYGDYEQAVELTNRALEQENVIIYEAAFMWDGLFIRTDILEKRGTNINLIEVKAKVFDPESSNNFFGKEGGINSKWKPYLFDLAFQKYVAQNARPEFAYSAWFLMPGKNQKASIDGLNQMFRIPKNDFKRSSVNKKVHSIEETGKRVLSNIRMDTVIDYIINDNYPLLTDNNGKILKFKNSVLLLKEAYQQDFFPKWKTKHSACKKCEFKTTEEEEAKGLKSGFKHCFMELNKWNKEDFKKPNVLDIWDIRSNYFFENGILFLDQVTEDDLKFKTEQGKISRTERQWLQVSKARERDNAIFFMRDELKEEIQNWKFPLHFIDFETSAVALPFHKGLGPYEQVAFQYSHHQYNKNGSIDHQSQFICAQPGEFPNFKFARALFNTLKNDNGTIFRYAAHENTILNCIIHQLEESSEEDKEELQIFLREITYQKVKNRVVSAGSREMVDLLKTVKDFYYNPHTNGSNSLKDIIPASLSSSRYLREKYSNPIGKIGLTSLNFPPSHIWLKSEGTTLVNPYKMLPVLFEDWTEEQMQDLIGDTDYIANGGQALMAYAKLQFVEMDDVERNEIIGGLLKYCELDTLAMVMLYEHLRFDLI